jgi:hypothetical protein
VLIPGLILPVEAADDCGPVSRQLCDEDVIQVVGKTVTQQRHDKNYGKKVQTYMDNWKSKKKKAPLKT